MADNKLFRNLKKLFSSPIVVRNIGGKQLKVVDSGQIQSVGVSGKNDRYTQMYSTLNSYGLRQQQALYGIDALRLILYRDYEVMDRDSIIGSALDIYSEEATMKNEMGDVIRIKAPSGNVRSVLENLFYDILNIEFTLPTWVRGMCKYGDYYLQLELSENFGVTNVLPLPVYEVKRVERFDRERPAAVKFVIEGTGTGELEYFEVAHFRMMTDSNFLPYGKSMVESARRVWKQLILMEDAMLIHRIMRAPERRIFSIDVGNIAPNEVDAYMRKIISQVKKVPYIDPSTGEYNLKFNLQNMTEDFYLPVRGGDSGTSIDTLSGLSNEGQIEDIEYLRNKLMAALKIPKAFLGYEEQIGSKSTLAAEDVRFARTIEKIQKIIVAELKKIARIHLYVQGFKGNDLVDFEIELTNPSIIFEQEKIELWNSKFSLARDAKDIKMMSNNWIYKNIFNMTEDEIAEEKKGVDADQKRNYRLQQIEDEGNDPAESQQGFGGSSPNEFGENKNYNLKFDEEKEYIPVDPSKDGRRGKNIRTRDKDEPFGDDPIGKKDYDKILKLDREIGYDANKKKHLSRKIKKDEDFAEEIKKVISEKYDLKKLKNYFLDKKEENIEKSDKENKENE